MRKRLRSWTSPPARASISRSHRGWSPREWGHHSGGSATSTVHSTRFSPTAAWWLWTCSVPATVVRRYTAPPSGTSSTARSSSRAWAALPPSPMVTSAHTARAWRIATVPLERSRTGRHRPPTITSSDPHSSGSCSAPVRVVRLSGSPKRRQVASTASRCSRRAADLVGDLKFVWHEVAVGVPEVDTVEPDVALLGQPLDPQPPPGAARLDPGVRGRIGRSLEAPPVQHRLLGGEVQSPGALGPVAGHLDLGPARVVVVELVERAPLPLGGRSDPPRAAQIHGPKLPAAVVVPPVRLMRARRVAGGGRLLARASPYSLASRPPPSPAWRSCRLAARPRLLCLCGWSGGWPAVVACSHGLRPTRSQVDRRRLPPGGLRLAVYWGHHGAARVAGDA